MHNLPLQYAAFVAEFVVIFLAVYFVIKLSKREKTLERKELEIAKKEGRIDIDYHQIVDNALTKERKILEDAINESKKILTDTQYVSQNSKEEVDKALVTMISNIQRETDNIGKQSVIDYKNYLNNLSAESLGNFQNVTKGFAGSLEAQIKEFRDSLLPNLEKEIKMYKEDRLKKIDIAVNEVIKKVSQKALNKSIPLEDHNKLIIESLERAKKEGLFG